jgi:hypothetical protein
MLASQARLVACPDSKMVFVWYLDTAMHNRLQAMS